MRQILAVIERIFRQLKHDPRTMVMLLVIPNIVLLFFGYAFAGELTNVPVYVLNDDAGVNVGGRIISISDVIIHELDEDEHVKIIEGDKSWTEVEDLMRNGKISVAIYFPENFTTVLYNRAINETYTGKTSIVLLLDGTNPRAIQSVMGALQEVLKEQSPSQFLNLNEIYLDGIELDSIAAILPQMMAFIINFYLVLIAALIGIRERFYRTKAILDALPVKPWKITLGYIISLTIVGLIISSVLVLVSHLLFNVPILGNAFLLFFVIFLFTVGVVSLALLLSNVAHNELQAIQLAPGTVIPSLVLSGVILPIESLPSWLQVFSYLIPLTYAVHSITLIMLKNPSIETISLDLFALSAFAILMFILIFLKSKDIR